MSLDTCVNIKDMTVSQPNGANGFLIVNVTVCTSPLQDVVDSATTGKELQDNRLRSIDTGTVIHLTKTVLHPGDDKQCVVIDITEFPTIRVAVRGEPNQGSLVRSAYDTLNAGQALAVVQNLKVGHLELHIINI